MEIGIIRQRRNNAVGIITVFGLLLIGIGMIGNHAGAVGYYENQYWMMTALGTTVLLAAIILLACLRIKKFTQIS